MAKATIEQAEGYPTIHMWEQSGTGERWACCAYDHGPMCRLCQPVDEMLGALLESCADGDMLARAEPDGQFTFKSTAKGNAKAENLIWIWRWRRRSARTGLTEGQVLQAQGQLAAAGLIEDENGEERKP
jgi:hypothetical protein